jgi:hypothetical protein
MYEVHYNSISIDAFVPTILRWANIYLILSSGTIVPFKYNELKL